MKSYTDLNQSKKLAEILPIESADMWFANGIVVARDSVDEPDDIKGVSPRWSLTALLDVLPEYNLQRTDWGNKTEYKIVVTVNDNDYASKNYDNPITVCYETIIKLNERNLL